MKLNKLSKNTNNKIEVVLDSFKTDQLINSTANLLNQENFIKQHAFKIHDSKDTEIGERQSTRAWMNSSIRPFENRPSKRGPCPCFDMNSNVRISVSRSKNTSTPSP